MGLTVSRADSTLPPPGKSAVLPPTAAAIVQQNAEKVSAAKTEEVVDYSNLPAPVRYEELQRESMTCQQCRQLVDIAMSTDVFYCPHCAVSLKPELFEGLRFDFTKPLNQNFALCHSIFMGNMDVPTQNNQPIKMPVGTYEFGANLVSNEGNMLIGRVLTDGRMSGRAKYDLTRWLSLKAQVQLAPEAGMSQCMVDWDLKGVDWNGQLKLGSNHFYGVNYLQSVTPQLALGGEAFWLGQQRKSGAGFAGRHAGDRHVATVQVATTGLVSLTYLHKVSEKVSLASDFLWNWNSREASAAFGYDYVLRQCRLRGRLDTDGKVACYLEERVNVGVNFILSGEIDHWKKDYKFGLGMTLGE